MEKILPYQQVIIKTTYTRNGVANPFDNASAAKLTLREVIARVRADLPLFAAMDQKLVGSLLTVLEKDLPPPGLRAKGQLAKFTLTTTVCCFFLHLRLRYINEAPVEKSAPESDASSTASAKTHAAAANEPLAGL